MIPPDAIAAIKAASTAELLAVFGYGTLGPRLSGSSQISLAQTCEQAHRDLAAASSLLAPIGADETTAPDDLALPLIPTDDATARRLAIDLESGCADSWRFVLAQLSADPAGQPDVSAAWTAAVNALTDSAVRAVQWRMLADPATASVAFPGI